eukprot:scaffold34550_cov54-Cyclotella_meneghiniana.AAC.8
MAGAWELIVHGGEIDRLLLVWSDGELSWLIVASPVDFVGMSACRHFLGFPDLAVNVTYLVNT